MIRLFTALALVICIFASGCGKKVSEKLAEKMIEAGIEKDGGKANVDLSNGKMTISTTDKDGNKTDATIADDKVTVNSKDGTSTFASGGAAKIPDNFPKDVHVYKGASILTVMSMPEGFNVALQTKDSSDKVLGAYKEKMAADGWKEESSFNMPPQSMIAYKKDNRTATLMVMTEKDNTQINLTVVAEKQ